MRSNASGAGASSTSQRPSRSRVGRAVPMPYRRAGERPRAAAGGRLRLQRHHLRRRASARRALHADLRRDRDRGHRGALLRRVRRVLRPGDRRARSARSRPSRPRRRRRLARPPDRALPGPRGGRARPCIRRVAACVREIAERVPVAVASGAVRAEVEAVLAGIRLAPLMAAVVTADDVAQWEARPGGLPDRARPARHPRLRRAVVRGHPLRRHGGGRRRDALRRRRDTVSADRLREAGAEAVVAGLDWSIPTVRGLFA